MLHTFPHPLAPSARPPLLPEAKRPEAEAARATASVTDTDPTGPVSVRRPALCPWVPRARPQLSVPSPAGPAGPGVAGGVSGWEGGSSKGQAAEEARPAGPGGGRVASGRSALGQAAESDRKESCPLRAAALPWPPTYLEGRGRERGGKDCDWQGLRLASQEREKEIAGWRRSRALPSPSTSLPAPSTSLPAPSTSLPSPSTSLPAPSTSLPAPSTSLPE
jgi:hypothetical protein